MLFLRRKHNSHIAVVLLIFAVILCLDSFSCVFAKENSIFVQGTLKLRQQRYVNNGVLISRPVPFDERIIDIIFFNNIRSIPDYLQWLKSNIVYRKDIEGDIWSRPLDTLKSGFGDCEDFSFLNEAVLNFLGFKPKVLTLMRIGCNHAICVFKQENGYYSLIDNTRLVYTKSKNMTELAKYLFSVYHCYSLGTAQLNTKTQQVLYKRSDF